MSRLEDLDQGNEERSAGELVAGFSRAGNFPKDPIGRQALIAGLTRAVHETGVPAEQIVERCLAQSEYCPTDHDLLTVAGEIRDAAVRDAEAARDQKAEWERQYGPASKVDIEAAEIMEHARLAKELDKRVITALTKYFQVRGKYDPKVHLQKIPLREWYKAKEKLGFTLTPGERREMNR